MNNTAENRQASLVGKQASIIRDDEVIDLTGQVMASARTPVLHRVSMAITLFVLATMPIIFGAAQVWVRVVFTVVIFAAYLSYAWQWCRDGKRLCLSGFGMAVALFFVYTLFACLPLFGGVLGVLSPVRYHLLQQSSMLTGLEMVWPTLSYAPFDSVGWWSFLLSLGFLFILLKTFFVSHRMLKWTFRILLALAVLQGVYGILQALIPNLGVLWVSHMKAGLGNARGTWINRNHFAGYMGMMLPLLMGFSLSRVRWGRRLKFKTILASDRIHQHSLFLLAFVIMALALLFSKSRAGIMAAFLGMGFFMLLIKGKDGLMPRRIWIVAGVFISLTLLYGLRMGFDPIIDRFLLLDKGDSRLDFWRDSLAIIADHPLGIGLASFKYVFPVYNVTSINETVTPYYLHNDALQLLVETGWPGFFLLVGAYAAFLVRCFRRIYRMDFHAHPKRYFITAGACGGLVSISFHSLLDFNLQIPANAMYFVVLLALVSVGTQGTGHLKNNLSSHGGVAKR